MIMGMGSKMEHQDVYAYNNLSIVREGESLVSDDDYDMEEVNLLMDSITFELSLKHCSC